MPLAALARPAIRSGALEFDGRGTAGLPGGGAGRDVVLVPSEDVLLVAVNLPLSSPRQRMEAAPFAVEGMLAEPLSQTHVALGPEIEAKHYLVGVVNSQKLAAWGGLLTGTPFSAARLGPDGRARPRPPEGTWAVFSSDGRALVRRSDGSGFAVRSALLAAAWRIAGCPAVRAWGDPPPGELLAEAAGAFPETAPPDPLAAQFDLRRGGFAGSRFRASGFLRQAGWIAGIGAILLGSIWTADTLALARLAEQRREAARTLLQDVVPGGIPPGMDIAGQLARLLPGNEARPKGRFLPLLSSVSAALGAQADQVSVQNLSYDAAERHMNLELSAGDLAALQRVQATLDGAGIQATSGAATAENGGAQVRIVVQDSGAGG